MPMVAGVDPESVLLNPRRESVTLTLYDMIPNQVTLGSSHAKKGTAISD